MVSKKRPRYIVFPVDCMRGKAKKAYMNIGKVKVWNMYESLETIPSIKEIKSMDREQARAIITKLRELHTIKSLQAHWKLSGYMFYQILEELGLHTEKKGSRKAPTSKNLKETKKDDVLQEVALTTVEKPIEQPIQTQVITYVPEDKKPFKGFKIELGNTFTGEALSNSVLNIIGMLNKDSKFNINLEIEEVI